MELEHKCPYCQWGQWSDVNTQTQRSKELVECGSCKKNYLVTFWVTVEHQTCEIPGAEYGG